MTRPLVILLIALVSACASAPTSTATNVPPMCTATRTFFVDVDAEAWTEATRQALEIWRGAVPTIAYRFESGDHDAAECMTPVRLFDFDNLRTLGETDGGALLFERTTELDEEGRRALALHELGHLLFGLGHSTDKNSAMYPIVHAPTVLTEADVLAAQRAYR